MHKKSVVYQKIYQDSSKVVYCPMKIELQLDSNTELPRQQIVISRLSQVYRSMRKSSQNR
jgi:hypothetical protein